jgi:hypothetical protein
MQGVFNYKDKGREVFFGRGKREGELSVVKLVVGGAANHKFLATKTQIRLFAI